MALSEFYRFLGTRMNRKKTKIDPKSSDSSVELTRCALAVEHTRVAESECLKLPDLLGK